MFGRKLIHGSFEWICITDFLRADRLPWNVNILAPYADYAQEGPSTNQNLSSDSGGYFASVHINWNRLAQKIQFTTRGSLKTRAALVATPVTISSEGTVHIACKAPPHVKTPSPVAL